MKNWKTNEHVSIKKFKNILHMKIIFDVLPRMMSLSSHSAKQRASLNVLKIEQLNYAKNFRPLLHSA